MTDEAREHLFISYATEDAALADWLTLKLTSLGYKVWCDRFELLGGERFPRDIDKAIKAKTFRMLALLSKASLEKENPTKERTLALNIGRERRIDFLIPLKVEALSATDLNWMVSDITYIPFDRSWAAGLGQLVEKLDKIDAPKLLPDGSDAAIAAVFKDIFTQENEETLYSNIIAVERIPEIIQRFELRRKPNPLEGDQIAQSWPVYSIDDTAVLSFQQPPSNLRDRLNIRSAGAASWGDMSEIDRINSLNIVSHLLKKSIEAKCHQKGLKEEKEHGIYFPSGLLKANKIHFTHVDGKNSYVLCVGQRKKDGSKYRYHLSPSFYVRRDLVRNFSIVVQVRLFITDEQGRSVPTRSALSKRKHLCRNWWNDHWLKRSVAVLSYLSDGKDRFSFGMDQEEIVFSARFVSYQAGFGINESVLMKERTKEELQYLEHSEEEQEEASSNE